MALNLKCVSRRKLQWNHVSVFAFFIYSSNLCLWLEYLINLFVVVLWLSHVWLFEIPWTTVCQASLSLTIYLLEFDQTHVHWICDAIQPSHSLLPSSPAINLFQHQGLLRMSRCSHQVAKGLEPQLQHQSFQWVYRVDFL